MANEEGEYGDSLKVMIRSVLLSEKHGMTAKELQEVYNMFCGGTIPFAKLGYNSLDSYLSSIGDTAHKGRDASGQTIYFGVPNQSTNHIAKLVGRQKTKKKKSRIPRRSMGRAQVPRKEDKKIGYGGPFPGKGGYKGFKKGNAPPPRTPLTNVQNGPQSQPPPRRKQSPGPQESQVKPSRERGCGGSGGGGAANVAKDVPPRFRKKSGEQQPQPKGKPSKTKKVKTPISEEDAMDKMMKLLDDHPKGIYLKGMCDLFKQKYEEEVSFDLVEKMAEMDLCHKECILDDHVILYKKLEITAPKDRFSQRQVSMERNVTTTTMKAPKCLPSLVLPEENELEVFISLIFDTSHFYCYIVGEDYSEKLTELENKMLEFYSEKDQLILEDPPLVGHYYAAKSGNDWLRAIVEDIYDGLALCRFADHGDKEEVALSDLRHLPNRFCLLPEQSFACYLDRLDQIQITERMLRQFLWLALGRQCYTEIKSRDDPLRVVLYKDTRCINDTLLNISVLDKQW